MRCIRRSRSCWLLINDHIIRISYQCRKAITMGSGVSEELFHALNMLNCFTTLHSWFGPSSHVFWCCRSLLVLFFVHCSSLFRSHASIRRRDRCVRGRRKRRSRRRWRVNVMISRDSWQVLFLVSINLSKTALVVNLVIDRRAVQKVTIARMRRSRIWSGYHFQYYE